VGSPGAKVWPKKVVAVASFTNDVSSAEERRKKTKEETARSGGADRINYRASLNKGRKARFGVGEIGRPVRKEGLLRARTSLEGISESCRKAEFF